MVVFWGAYLSEQERKASLILAENIAGVRAIGDHRIPLDITYGMVGVADSLLSVTVLPTAQISEERIRLLVNAFYDKVRADADLGPIFMRAIPGDWARA